MVKSEIFTRQFWCEGGLQLANTVTNNVREYELNPRLIYDMVILDNWEKISTRGVIGYIRIWRTMCSEWLDFIKLKIQLNEFEIFTWV